MNLSHDLEESLQHAALEASNRKHEFITLEHLLFALTYNECAPHGSTACRPAASLAPPTPTCQGNNPGSVNPKSTSIPRDRPTGAVLFFALGRVTDRQNCLRLPVFWQAEDATYKGGDEQRCAEPRRAEPESCAASSRFSHASATLCTAMTNSASLRCTSG